MVNRDHKKWERKTWQHKNLGFYGESAEVGMMDKSAFVANPCSGGGDGPGRGLVPAAYR